MNEAPFFSLPIYTAATNAAPPPSTMPQPIHNSHSAPVDDGGGPKRNKDPQPPLIIPPGCTCFRLLCHASRIGGVLGKLGSVIKQLQEDTSAKIRVEDSPAGSDECVLTVVGDNTLNRIMLFDEECSQFNYGHAESSEYREVSAAQEALVRVYERVLTVAAEADGGYFAPGVVVSCRMLVDTSLVGCVIGRGGMVIDKIRTDTGCKIRIFNQDKLPSCAMPTDEMIQIEGNIVAIKKALIAVSRRLQDYSPFDKPRPVFGRPHNGFNFNREPTLRNGHLEFPPTSPANYASGIRAFRSSDAETSSSNSMDLSYTNDQQKIVFRILCSSDRVGGVIGKSGTIVRALQSESGASIIVETPTSDCDERLITITAIESPESRNSPAQNAVILVHNRVVEAGYERGLDLPSSGTPITARLVILPNQMGCLIGKGGYIMADMRKVTGAYIKIVGGDQVPVCASETDQVVLMTGDYTKVRDALYSVTSRLRNHIFSSKMLGGPDYFNQHTSLTESMNNLRVSSSGLRQSQAGGGNLNYGHYVGRRLNSVKDGIELGRGSRSAVVTNTTVEIMVPENVIGSVYGQNGGNLTRLRQISGAKVVVHGPSSGTSEYIVLISGAPNETQSAQSLLQAFILADQQL